ncbi:MAG: hypothetical protein ACRCUM_02740 [Mycoplasmoidaceae bacterium]
MKKIKWMFIHFKINGRDEYMLDGKFKRGPWNESIREELDSIENDISNVIERFDLEWRKKNN